MLVLVENDFNVVKRNNSLVTITEVSADVYLSVPSLIVNNPSYIEVFQND